MKKYSLIPYLLLMFFSQGFAQDFNPEKKDININSLFFSFTRQIPEQIRFVNGQENNQILNFNADLHKEFPDTISNPEKYNLFRWNLKLLKI